MSKWEWKLLFEDMLECIDKIENYTKGFDFEVVLETSERLRKVIVAGGLLNYTKKNTK